MDTPELIVSFAQHIVKHSIGKIRGSGSTLPMKWYCSACKSNLLASPLMLVIEKENIQHKPDCIYLQAKTIMLIYSEINDVNPV